MAIGLIAGAIRRQPVVLWLSLPVALTYLLFYGAYLVPVQRYLFIVELFAIPIAACGVASLLDALLGRMHSEASRNRVARVALVAAIAFGGAGWIRLAQRAEENRPRLHHIRAFVEALEAAVPERGVVLATRRLGEITHAFLDREVMGLSSATGSRMLRDPARQRAVIQTVEEAPAAYFLEGERWAPGAGQLLDGEFDRELVSQFATSTFGLEEILEPGSIRLYRMRPWSLREVAEDVEIVAPSPAILFVDPGRLSRAERSHARLYWDGALLDPELADHGSYHVVSFPSGASSASLRITSDGPLPARVQAHLLRLDEPLVLHFSRAEILDHLHRFSPSLLGDAKRAPAIGEEGWIDVPTLAPEGTGFTVSTSLKIAGRHRAHRHKISVATGGRMLISATPPRHVERADRRFVMRFEIPTDVATGSPTRLDWRVVCRTDAPPGGAALLIHSMQIRRSGSV